MLGNRTSQMNFSQAPSVNMARSQFDRSFTVKDAFDFDYLIPIFLDEMLPGDTANVNMSTFARLATQKVPIMDNMYIDYFFFFVPNRLIFTNWEKLCGAQTNPGDSTDYILPTVTGPAGAGFTVDSLYDKMGIPTGVASLEISNSLPFRAYNLIWNQWFRDENLQNSVVVDLDNGPDTYSDYVLLKRGKRHDYFTSALPFPQKGTAVDLPLGSRADIKGIGTITPGTAGAITIRETGSAAGTAVTGWYIEGSGSAVAGAETYMGVKQNATGVPDIYADLSTATAATINQLREAFMMQSLFELDARSGTRYVEILQAHFNVISPDFRLQRAEFLGGGSSRINSHPVSQTSPTSGSNALGQLGAFATSAGQGIGFTKSFVEHGYVIGLACARADLTYQQGMNKLFNRSTRYDFFWPKLQELGEQAILNKEIYCDGSANDELVFGYQERYAEYRYKPSEIHGVFRSTYATPLDQWHLAEEFSALPALNSTFIVQSTPIDRAIAINTEPHLIFDAWFSYKHARPMVTRPVPATLGRF